jgi:hypothetical protein
MRVVVIYKPWRFVESFPPVLKLPKNLNVSFCGFTAGRKRQDLVDNKNEFVRQFAAKIGPEVGYKSVINFFRRCLLPVNALENINTCTYVHMYVPSWRRNKLPHFSYTLAGFDLMTLNSEDTIVHLCTCTYLMNVFFFTSKMFWSLISAIFANNGIFYFKPMLHMIQFLHNLALFWVKNANFAQFFFGENIFKIITFIPLVQKQCLWSPFLGLTPAS